MYKIVIDTNLLIDGSEDDYNFGNRIIDEVLSGKLAAYANRPTLKENRFLVSQKVKDKEYRDKLDRYFEMVNLVDGSERLSVVDDPEDNKLLESAVAAQADYLLSSDRHLLKIGEYRGIKVLPPSGFWSVYQEETDKGWDSWLKSFIQ
ncbi:MAG: putative toxin-antitoxin system toxin component, PIN family [Candidatus Saccharibacteria bacterium]